MAAEKPDALLIGPPKPVIVNGLSRVFNLIRFPDAKDRQTFFAESGPRVQAMAVAPTEERVDGPFMTRFPRLEIVSSFGVGYDHVDAAWAGAHGILINMARGSVVDEPALIKALQEKTIMSAGLDVFAREPEVPPELIAMDHVVLFPHLGSASVATRDRMDQLVVGNLLAWATGKSPLTPVPETPWPPKQRKGS